MLKLKKQPFGLYIYKLSHGVVNIYINLVIQGIRQSKKAVSQNASHHQSDQMDMARDKVTG